MSDVTAFEKSTSLCMYLRNGGKDPRKIGRMWRAAFSRVLREMGFNRKARKVMWDMLALGNWKRLHQTEEEKLKTREEWLEALQWEVFYCSDRWSLDRLTRCHWLYRQWAGI
ncbi:MAG: hypothetical protein IKF14_13595 [Atopobiaceae bacterium]|nr:hypothetical protein [Atopobiaceae bacterium]